ncbi:MAG: ABC transporter permease [Defluviitaleaceae bacterium]|nr:ABC transporter permease [Defluviitaleaceae bacterium]
MKTKISLTLMLLLMLAGMVIISYRVNLLPELFLAIPRISGTTLPVQTLAEASRSGTKLTYESRQLATVTAINTSHDVILVGTNHYFPFVMGHYIPHGRFFREDAVRYAHHVAVLNQHAAFILFGTHEATGNTLIIDETPYVVFGIIDDKDNNHSNIYIPITRLSNTVETIITNLSITTDMIRLNEWQRLGIGDNQYYFVNFSIRNTVIRNRPILALIALVSAILVSILIRTKPHIWKLLLILPLVILWMNAFTRILVAYSSRNMLTDIQSTGLTIQMANLIRYDNLSNIFFLVFIIIHPILIFSLDKMHLMICSKRQ